VAGANFLPISGLASEAGRAEPAQAKPSQAEPSPAGPAQADPSRAIHGPHQAGPSCAEQSWAKPSWWKWGLVGAIGPHHRMFAPTWPKGESEALSIKCQRHPPMYVCMCVCMYVCVYVCMYVCMYCPVAHVSPFEVCLSVQIRLHHFVTCPRWHSLFNVVRPHIYI